MRHSRVVRNTLPSDHINCINRGVYSLVSNFLNPYSSKNLMRLVVRFRKVQFIHRKCYGNHKNSTALGCIAFQLKERTLPLQDLARHTGLTFRSENGGRTEKRGNSAARRGGVSVLAGLNTFTDSLILNPDSLKWCGTPRRSAPRYATPAVGDVT